MPAQQKALLLTAKQGDFVVADVDIPTPGPGDLLVKIHATALNPADWKIQAYGMFVDTFPAVLGFDAAGTVEAVGQGVTGFAKGDPVLYEGTLTNDRATFQQYGLATADLTAKIPSNVSFDQAASLPATLATAALGLYNTDPASSVELTAPWEASGLGKYAGTPFVVFGGSSSVGQYVLQLAKLSGFSPIITTASPHNAPLLRALGATHVLDRSLAADALAAAVAQITTAPLRTIFDAVSLPATQLAAYGLLAPGGALVLTLPDAVPPEHRRADRHIKNVYGVVDTPPTRALGVRLFAALPALLAQRAIKPNAVEVLPGGLAGIVGGLDRLHRDQVSARKLVARPQETA